MYIVHGHSKVSGSLEKKRVRILVKCIQIYIIIWASKILLWKLVPFMHSVWKYCVPKKTAWSATIDAAKQFGYSIINKGKKIGYEKKIKHWKLRSFVRRSSFVVCAALVILPGSVPFKLWFDKNYVSKPRTINIPQKVFDPNKKSCSLMNW